MAQFGIVNIGVDASFEDVRVVGGLRERFLCGFAQLYIEKGGDVAQVEDACISELDGFLEELLRGQHFTCDDIPCSPQPLPVLGGWECGTGIYRRDQAECHFRFGKHMETCAL